MVSSRKRVPSDYWKDKSNHRNYFDDLGNKMNIKSLDDWYDKLSAELLKKNGGSRLLVLYSSSPIFALKSVYPEHNWLEWKFHCTPMGFWKSTESQKKFFDWLGKEIGIHHLDDWYEKLSQKLIMQYGGTGLLTLFNGSPYAALKSAYPQHNWIPWKFNVVPLGFWKSVDNQRKFFDWLAQQIGISKPDDWYQKLSVSVMINYGGSGLLDFYNGSLMDALRTIYPEIKWVNKHQKLKELEVQQKNENIRELQSLFEKLQLSQQEWYQVSIDNLDGPTKKLVESEFKGNLYSALCTIFPNLDWHAWKFRYQTVPSGYWKDLSNQRKFFDDLGKNLGISTLDDWYDRLSARVIEEYGGRTILSWHHESPVETLMAVYPSHHWESWKFKYRSIPPEHWKDHSNQTKFFEELGKQIGISSLDDWYDKLSYKLVRENGGSGLVEFHDGSALKALMSAYPHHNWMPWKFLSVPSSFWDNKDNLQRYFDWLGNQLDVTELDDWYNKLSWRVLDAHCGNGIAVKYGSPIRALTMAYPKHDWITWKFKQVPNNFWNSQDNITEFLADLTEKLSLQTLDDWYRVDMTTLKQFGALTLVTKYKGLYEMLKQQYPHHPWDPKKFKQTGKKAQRWLVVTLKKLFPEEEILEDYIHPKAFFPETMRPMQLDVFIPSQSLAFEYQGKQHYQDIGVFSPAKAYQQRDEAKRLLCVANNIKLIEVPYWWNRKQDSLEQIINSA